MILTDANGRPFEAPTPPAPDAPIEEKIAWLRASSAYNDKVAALAHRTFDTTFRKTLRK